MRGDNLSSFNQIGEHAGSPPRARGQPRETPPLLRRYRFTPACAGTTARLRRARWYCAVHPRMRGDNSALSGDNAISVGSPPRARGQRAHRPYPPARNRFTPACAGTTPVGRDHSRRLAVHPRVRGDNAGTSFSMASQPGSPPRARGQPVREIHTALYRRFTPACAGTTSSGPSRCAPGPVHPRVRGDNKRRLQVILLESGSPPRARGQQNHLAVLAVRRRFTPACAGTTLKLCLIFLDSHQPKAFEVFDPP